MVGLARFEEDQLEDYSIIYSARMHRTQCRQAPFYANSESVIKIHTGVLGQHAWVVMERLQGYCRTPLSACSTDQFNRKMVVCYCILMECHCKLAV